MSCLEITTVLSFFVNFSLILEKEEKHSKILKILTTKHNPTMVEL